MANCSPFCGVKQAFTCKIKLNVPILREFTTNMHYFGHYVLICVDLCVKACYLLKYSNLHMFISNLRKYRGNSRIEAHIVPNFTLMCTILLIW